MHKSGRFVKDALGTVGAIGAGYSVWAFSPMLAGVPLPWDAAWPFYSIAFIATGAVLSFVADRVWPCACGAWAGQVGALIALPLDRTANMWGEGAWWTLGVLAAGIGSLIVVAGWLLARAVRKRLFVSGR